MLPRCSRAQPAAQAAEEDGHPDEQAEREQDLPEAAQIEVLEALVAEPGPAVAAPAVDAGELADQAARPRRRPARRAARRPSQLLTARLAPGDHRGQEDAGGEERGRHPEDRELDVPGARQVVREQLRQIDAEEAATGRRGSAAWRRRPASARRNSAAMARKKQAVARWAGVSATSPGRDEATACCCSRPCQPRKSQRPKAANSSPMPPSNAISESTLQTSAIGGRGLPTSGSGGQLFV